MSECPTCKTNNEITKTWRYSRYTVNCYVCKKCSTTYRCYVTAEGKQAFTLKATAIGSRIRYTKA